MHTLGIISDTHGYLDPKVPKLFAGVDQIIHAGDVGSPEILLKLESIAPVTAVLGNTDYGLDLKLTESLLVNGWQCLVHHIVNPSLPPADIRDRLALSPANAVFFGHTHKPHESVQEGVLYLNPGYAGKKRFKLSRSLALVHFGPTDQRIDFMPL